MEVHHHYHQDQTQRPALPKGLSVASMVLGICSLVFWYPVIGLALAIVAVVLAITARKRIAQATYSGAGIAMAGLVTGIIGCCIGGLVTVLVLAAAGS